MPKNSGNKWTSAEEERLRELFESGLSKFLIAAKLKRPVTAISARAQGMGISTKRTKIGLKAKK